LYRVVGYHGAGYFGHISVVFKQFPLAFRFPVSETDAQNKNTSRRGVFYF